MNIKIGLTGGSGNMGVEALKQFLELEFIDKIKSGEYEEAFCCN